MSHSVRVTLPNSQNIDVELDDSSSPKTVKKFLDSLPFTVGINLWGEEIYTDETPIDVGEENAKSLVDLMDIAYWPTGRAICLFFGPTPIGKKGEIKPYSPVNVIGRIRNPDKSILKNLHNGMKATFHKKNSS
ncbi:MAG: cyclophilin-like fold protein [Nitrosopumilaceae archaeon]